MKVIDNTYKIVDNKELVKSLKSVDWQKYLTWGTVKVIIKKGQPVSAYIEQIIDIS